MKTLFIWSILCCPCLAQQWQAIVTPQGLKPLPIYQPYGYYPPSYRVFVVPNGRVMYRAQYQPQVRYERFPR